MRPIVLYVCAAMAAGIPAAHAQTNQQPAAAHNPCQAQPAQPGDAAKNAQPTPPASDSLTDKLNPCGGVLKPPPTGDAEMAAPAPPVGKTPIIKPGEVPPQPPQQN